MARNVKPSTVFLKKLAEHLTALSYQTDRFCNGVTIRYQVPYLATETTLVVNVYGHGKRQEFSPYKEEWYCDSIRYIESHTHERYHHSFSREMMPHEVCEWIIKNLIKL